VPDTQIFVDKISTGQFKLVANDLGDVELVSLIGTLLLYVSPTKRTPWS
jgi:hypothetical protein